MTVAIRSSETALMLNQEEQVEPPAVVTTRRKVEAVVFSLLTAVSAGMVIGGYMIIDATADNNLLWRGIGATVFSVGFLGTPLFAMFATSRCNNEERCI